MSNSVVKVTETPINDSLILVIGEDGTVTPDKKTVEAYLNSRSGETELQIMQVNKSDGKTVDVTVDTLTYIANHNEEETSYNSSEEMNELERNLMNFRMDHDYTQFTSTCQSKQEEEMAEIDELAQTLSRLEGSNSISDDISLEIPVQETAPPKPVVKTKKNAPLNTSETKTKTKPVQNTSIIKQPTKTVVKIKNLKPKLVEIKDVKNDSFSDDDFTLDSEESDDENDSDFEIDQSPRIKTSKKTTRRRRSKAQLETAQETSKLTKAPKSNKSISSKPANDLKVEKVETEPSKLEKPTEVNVENKTTEKKVLPKKEKKTPKPIPDDFALFSTPDIIRRVSTNKQDLTPNTPSAPNNIPEPSKSMKPAKIFQNNMTKLPLERTSLESKDKGLNTEKKVQNVDKHNTHRLSLNLESKVKDRRLSLDIKTERHSVENKVDALMTHKNLDKVQMISTAKSDVTLGEFLGGCSNESQLEQSQSIPSIEDIRSIIQNEDTKSFTNDLIIPESSDQPIDHSTNQSHISDENGSLDLDQSLLDNINTDLLSEDILYQVAQSLVDNKELQNAIDKSLVDEHMQLDEVVSQTLASDHGIILQQASSSSNQVHSEVSSSTKGTQVLRSGGRVVVIPPLERPTTRSRNRRTEEDIGSKSIMKFNKLLDDEHVSGAELDSSSGDEKSDDDPNKLWCICNQPHNNRFMICCDNCEEWYHGKCVNVTKAMGKMMEQQGKEWICIFCKDSSLRRPAAAARRVRKASRNSNTDSSNEKKTETTPSVEATTTVPGCLVCGKPCRTNSIYCSDPCILKHAKVVEKVVVFERSSGTIYSGSNAPSSANLDQWLQQHPGFEVVRSTNPNKPLTTKLSQSKLKLVKNRGEQGGVSLAVQQKGVNIGVMKHSPKQQPEVTPSKTSNKQSTPMAKIANKQSSTPSHAKLIQPPSTARPQLPVPTPKQKLTQTTLKPIVSPKEKPVPQKTPKARQEETSPLSNKQENIRDNVRKTLLEQLTNRLNMIDDIKLTRDEVTKISSEIETQLYKCFGDTGQKYRNKYRSLIFNIKDIKNQTLWRRICEKSINPYQLVRLSPDDLASQELALWRERENKHQLDMITKSELEQLGRNRQYVFKTHKGEQVLEDSSRPSDAVENTEVVMGLSAEQDGSNEVSSKKDSKEREKKSSKHSQSNRNKHREHRKSSKERDRKSHKRSRRSSSRDKNHRKRSRSKDSGRHSDKNRSKAKDRDKYRHRSSHRSSRHRKDSHKSTEKLDKKSKEILEQLVDNKIVPPLEDRLWKHVQDEDIIPAPIVESDSDHEPTSTVTIPTPPRITEADEPESKSPFDETIETQEEIREQTPATNQTHLSAAEDDDSRSPPPRKVHNYIWKGVINMVDVAQISITAHEVSGDCAGLGQELPPCLDVVGRISPETVWEYIGKMKCSNSKTISLLRLTATNMEEKMPYIALYSYLSSRNRLGVIKSTNKAVKDFYILPLASQKPIPQSLLPITGPGFEESRPPLLLGIIVRDKRKRPLFEPPQEIASKKQKMPASSTTTPLPVIQATITPSRSYTPPPAVDLRIPQATTIKSVVQEKNPKEDENMDEPYSPEDSDPDIAPVTVENNPNISSHLNTSDLSNLLTVPVKTSSFLETGLNTQTFQPFSNKFDTIPGLEENTTLPANSQEIQRKMEELDQRIAKQKAEIQNMSQDIASSTTTGIGTSALANIALPSNLQQILDSIKGINPGSTSDSDTTKAPKVMDSTLPTSSDSDLTIPLILPKINARSHAGSANLSSSPTIPLNLPKSKNKFSSIIPPLVHDYKESATKTVSSAPAESSSVLSSLSEEQLIKKAAEMLGESHISESTSINKGDCYNPTYGSHASTNITSSTLSSKNSLLDNQPPIPGLDD